MDHLPFLLKRYNYDLKPANSECIDVQSAKTILYPGAHISASNPFEYYHHGIVIDPNAPDISIIHLWGPDKHHCRVQRTNLTTFLAGSPENVGKKTRQLYLINYEGDTLEKQQETVRIAEETLKNADGVEYDLATCNCESFACYCRTGNWDTVQTTKIINLLSEKAPEIYEEVKNTDEKNKQHIASVLKTISDDALSPSERKQFDDLCQAYLHQKPEQK